MEPNIATIAGLIGEETRAAMLMALMSGKALTATELAIEADITAQTASSHLNKLVDGELLIVRKQGRHKYFQLANRHVADLLEQILTLSASHASTTQTGPSDPHLKYARICYDHLAGEIGVSLYRILAEQEVIMDQASHTALTPKGERFFSDLGIDIEGMKKQRRPVCKSCLDWSERQNHLAGSLGQYILSHALQKQWAYQSPGTRIIQFSDTGLAAFLSRYTLK
ncbi:ArsR/SmtB family transcription factor [Enterovibrio norvegicus]|uniref:ArsR/SmtB family transcription factor n=1 Tax=Enterovibrio norvegicus TaxID=188144 RepID=UPI000C820CA3|nr:winged helix-turn-helix domain-containing protein [Enterovibrio norvegicus]PMN68517.1 transcriptional regulator [Enterovibrio norvegicus]